MWYYTEPIGSIMYYTYYINIMYNMVLRIVQPCFDVPIGRPMLPTKIVFLEHGLNNFSAARARWIAPLGAENFHGGRRAKKKAAGT